MTPKFVPANELLEYGFPVSSPSGDEPSGAEILPERWPGGQNAIDLEPSGFDSACSLASGSHASDQVGNIQPEGQLGHLDSSGQTVKRSKHFQTLRRATWHLRFHCWDELGSSQSAVVFRTWVSLLSSDLLKDKVRVLCKYRSARCIADAAHAHDSNASRQAWHSWLHEGPANGLGRQHFMSRVATGWIPAKQCSVRDVIDCQNGGDEDDTILDDVNDISDHDIDGSLRSEWVPLNAQQAVNQEAEAWADVWQQGVQGNMPRWPLQLGDRLPDLAVDTFREACYTFSNGVGLGWDKLHPRAIARCSDVVINALLQLFALAEASGKWQETIGIILVVLIPKSDGGRRPIGLFPTLIRVWMRARLPVARLWMLQNDRSFFYAGPCKGADVAAWKQNLLGEAAHFMELPYVSSLLDLVKAFDSVPFDCLVECATRLGYNLYLLRLSIVLVSTCSQC